MLYIFILCFPFHCIYSFKHYTFYVSIYCPDFRMTINFTHDKNSISYYAFKADFFFFPPLKFRLSFLNQVSILVGVIKIARHLFPAVCWDTFHAVYSPAFISLAFPYLPFPIAFLEHKKYDYSKYHIWLFFFISFWAYFSHFLAYFHFIPIAGTSKSLELVFRILSIHY